MSDEPNNLNVPSSETPLRRAKTLNHIKTWKDFYQILGLILATGLSCLSVYISSRAVRVTTSALELQRQEAERRTRPRLNVIFPRITDGTRSVNGFHQNGLSIIVANLSEIEATDVSVVMEIWDLTAGMTNSLLKNETIMKDDPSVPTFPVPLDKWNDLTNSKFFLRVNVTYTMDGNTNRQFRSAPSFSFDPNTGIFRSGPRDYR